ncbi:type VI secretion system-associated protein TagF [Rhizobium terrae]|uniref:type VI secretion system-associated protein TagF n=1 Tax=Rhizobium terrae TaxID=2171756 RepID=UPI0013C2E773|nr:type VI secretion system-associated protein TagF [Rhizobium terrae]
MELLGYFGKVPSARDFVFHGLPARVTEAWAGIVAGWMVSIRNEGDDAFQRGVLSSPVWRFLAPAGFGGAAGVNGAAGLLAGSIDGAGRVFPFSVLMVSRHPSGVIRPDARLDKALDRIEAAMLAFMEDQIAKEDFIAALKAVTGDLSLVARETTASGSMLSETEAAACFTGVDPAWSGERAVQVISLPFDPAAPALQKAVSSESYWWHDGHASRPPQFYVVRGLPADATVRPLFLADWPVGWQMRTHDGEVPA